MRAWRGARRRRAGTGHRPYGLVYLTQELAILSGPLLLSAVVAAANASVALVTVAGVTCVGTLGFAASLPSHLDRPPGLPRERSGSLLRAPGMRALILAGGLVGGVIGAIEVGVPTFAAAHHAPAASGLLIAVLSLGGIAGAAVYGARRWERAPTGRLLMLLAALTLAAAITIPAPGLLALGVVLVLVGIPLSEPGHRSRWILRIGVQRRGGIRLAVNRYRGQRRRCRSRALAGAVSHPGMRGPRSSSPPLRESQRRRWSQRRSAH